MEGSGCAADLLLCEMDGDKGVHVGYVKYVGKSCW